MERMIKKSIFFALLVISLLIPSTYNNNPNLSIKTLINLAHAQDSENNGGGNDPVYYSGFKMGSVTIEVKPGKYEMVYVGSQVGYINVCIEKPEYATIKCCESTSQKSACDFSSQDERC